MVLVEPQQRERDLAAFDSIANRLTAEVEDLRLQRAEDRRTLDAVLRYVRATSAELRRHGVPAPPPDPNDEVILVNHRIP